VRISKLYMENFRSIKKLNIELPQVCALVGPNNAGKSNILQAIYRSIGRDWVSVSSFNDDDVYGRDPKSDMIIRLDFDPPLQYRKFKFADPVDIHGFSFEYTRYKVGEEGRRRLEQKCFDSKGKEPQVLVKAPKKGEPHKYMPLVNIPSELREGIPLIYIGTNRSLKSQLPGSQYSLLRQLFEDIDRDLNDPDRTIKIKCHDGSEKEVARSDHFKSLMSDALELLKTDKFKELESSIKCNALRLLGFDPELDSDKLDFHFCPFESMDFYKALDLKVREGDFEISATELGEGIQNALVLSILQAFEERRKQGAILLIEEPEMFLHPQMQRSLNKTLRKIGKTNQVIFTTHSPHFVSVPDYHEIVMVRKGKEGTVTRLSDLATDVKRREKLLKELDPERNELFFATRLLIVEGDTEKLALPEYAKRLSLDLDYAGATIVEVGGKRNLLELANIAISFNIPTGILYDTDSSDFKSKPDDEKIYNGNLEKLARADGSVKVWHFEGNYEKVLSEALGDKYSKLCGKYPYGKPTQARLIATESDLSIPKPLEEVLKWLADKTEEKDAPEKK
jgi:putative ATP-dependent endonuclease of the OLD family